MKCLFTFFCLFIAVVAHAWDFSDLGYEAISPVTTPLTKKVLLYGAGTTLSILLLEDSIVDASQRNMVNEKPLGSLSRFGDLAGQMIPNALYVLGGITYGVSGNVEGYSRALGMFKATAYASSVTTVLKYSIREPRPIGDQRNSFPSGHSTTAFAFGGYVLGEHGWGWGLPALTMASFVGASRMNDNRHYLHDVVAGMTIGLSYGLSLSLAGKNKGPLARSRDQVSFVPLFSNDVRGISFIKEF